MLQSSCLDLISAVRARAVSALNEIRASEWEARGAVQRNQGREEGFEYTYLSIHDRDGAGSVIRHEICVQNDGLSIEVGWILTQINGPDAGIERGLGLRSPI